MIRQDAVPPFFLPRNPPTNHLHVAYRAEYLSCDQDHVGLRRIKSGGQHAVVAQHAKFSLLETVEEIAPRDPGCAAADSGGGDARVV